MKYILTSCLITVFGVFHAQCPTAEAILKEKSNSKEKNPYAISSQSRSGAITSEQAYEMSFIAQDGMDYRISTKAAKADAGSISYEVYELIIVKKTENGKDVIKREKHVLSSSAENGGKPLEFSTDKARKVFVSVTLSGGDKKKTQCVGVLIENKRSTKLGF